MAALLCRITQSAAVPAQADPVGGRYIPADANAALTLRVHSTAHCFWKVVQITGKLRWIFQPLGSHGVNQVLCLRHLVLFLITDTCKYNYFSSRIRTSPFKAPPSSGNCSWCDTLAPLLSVSTRPSGSPTQTLLCQVQDEGIPLPSHSPISPIFTDLLSPPEHFFRRSAGPRPALWGVYITAKSCVGIKYWLHWLTFVFLNIILIFYFNASLFFFFSSSWVFQSKGFISIFVCGAERASIAVTGTVSSRIKKQCFVLKEPYS